MLFPFHKSMRLCISWNKQISFLKNIIIGAYKCNFKLRVISLSMTASKMLLSIAFLTINF